MKLLVVTTLCALMALPMSAQVHECGYHNGEYENTMTRKQLNAVVDLISGTSFDDAKLKVAEVCIQLHPANTACIREMARCFSFSEAKQKFLYFAIDYCTDVRNYYTLRDVISFSSDQQKFLNYVDDYMNEYTHIQSGRR